MVYYQVSKSDLHNILRLLGALEKDEEIINVSNVPFMRSESDTVGILASSKLHANWADISPNEMTEAELHELQNELVTLEMLLQREHSLVRGKVAELWKIMRRRKLNNEVNTDGVPLDVDARMTETLRTLLCNSDGAANTD